VDRPTCPPTLRRCDDGCHPRRARITHGSRPRPAKTARRNHRSRHHSSSVLTAYAYMLRCGPCNSDPRRTAAFNRMLLTNEYRRVRKLIQMFLFKVRIFKLHLTSLICITLLHNYSPNIVTRLIRQLQPVWLRI